MQKCNFREADYESIVHDLYLIDWRLIEHAPLDAAVDFFYSTFNASIRSHAPVLRRTSSFYWFSRALIKMIGAKERARRKWKRSGLDTDYAYADIRSKALASSCYDAYLSKLQNIPNNLKLFWSFTTSKMQTNSTSAYPCFHISSPLAPLPIMATTY